MEGRRVIGDRYSLDREIGRGGMGAVWLGRDELLGRAVALKRVGVGLGGATPDLKRAEREARIAASLNHPNIVGVFDLVEDGDQQYLVMEYVQGTTLAEVVRERGALPPEQAARILSQVAAALSAAHANHVVHRDVKPSNILVRDDGQVKLSDFGIARSEADASLTQTGLVTGSPAYLSPEVASGKLATPASDVWSLGATLFHALAGRPPYDVGDNVLGALYQIVNEPPPRLDDAGEMTPVLLATMAHDPRRRWSMEDVAGVLSMLADTSLPAGAAAARTPHVPTTPTTPMDAGTQHLQSVPPSALAAPVAAPAPAPAPAPEPTEVQPVQTVPPVAAPTSRARRRRPVLPILVGLLVLALVVAIVALVLVDDPQQPTPSAVTDPPSSTAGSPTQEPTTTEPTNRAPTEAELEDFIGGYLGTASSDPEAGFAQLTPRFQRASGGLEGYSGFWGEVSDPRLLSFSADPEALTVSYTYRYDFRGEGSREEPVSLQLVQDGDRLLIDGEPEVTGTSETSDAFPATPPMPGLDVERLDSLRDLDPGDTSYLDRAIGNFQVNSVDAVAAIRAAVEDDDAVSLKARSHKIAGSALNLGVPRAGRAARAVEIAADTGSVRAAVPLLDELDQSMAEGRELLLAYRATYSSD